jgi:hypothetical protein
MAATAARAVASAKTHSKTETPKPSAEAKAKVTKPVDKKTTRSIGKKAKAKTKPNLKVFIDEKGRRREWV